MWRRRGRGRERWGERGRSGGREKRRRGDAWPGGGRRKRQKKEKKKKEWAHMSGFCEREGDPCVNLTHSGLGF